MAQYFHIHAKNPQLRLLKQAVDILNKGGLIVYPTDSSYAIGCHLGDKDAMERIYKLRQLDKTHNFTLVCRDLSQISGYAKIDNTQYRLIKACTPGAYTFILPAKREVPRRLMHPKRKTIGLRIPDSEIVQTMLELMHEPIMSSTLIMPNDKMPLSDPDEIRERLEHQVDLVIDGGVCGFEASTVIEWTDNNPVVLRQGKGDASLFAN